MAEEHLRSKRLKDAVILLVYGVPEPKEGGEDISDEQVRNMEDQITRVDEAVTSLARAVFSANGRLAFADDALLTPLIAQIASEYWEPPAIEPAEPPGERKREGLEPVIVYEPRSELAEIEAFTRPGYVRVQDEIPSELAAVIAIGGTSKQSHQFATWQNRAGKIAFYTIASAGGLAASLREKSPLSDSSNDIRLWERIESARKEITFPVDEKQFNNEERAELPEERIPEFRYSIYPLLMSNIVDEVAKRLGR